jgi:hypothetical protein
MLTDCRIGATQDFIIKAGETWQVRLNITDANNTPIDLTGFTIGPLVMYNKISDTVVMTIPTDEIQIDGTSAIINFNTPAGLKKIMGLNKGDYYKCPFVAPGGGPIAILSGLNQIDARK